MLNFLRKKKEEPDDKSRLHSAHSLLYGYSNDLTAYNPDDLIIKKGNEVYEKMIIDDQIKAVLAFKMAALLSRGWYFDIGVDNEEHVKIADFFDKNIELMKGSFSDKLKMVLSAYRNGFSITEKLWRVAEIDGENYWIVDDLRLKPFSTFTFEVDPTGDILGLSQEIGMKKEKVPLEKVIHHVYQPEEDALYGRSDLRSCYRAWYSKDIAIRFQNIHLERHSSGIPTITAEEGANTDHKSAIKQMLRNISIRTGFYLPRGYKMEIHSPKTTDAFERAVAQHDKSIAKSVLVPNLLGISEQGNTGSYSQSKIQFETFLWVIHADTSSLVETLNEQLWKELAWYNFGTKDYPKMKMGELTPQQKLDLAKLWSELVKGNAVENTPEDEAFTRQLLNYPERDMEDIEDDDEEDPIDEDLLPDGLDPEDPALFQEFSEKPWLRRVNFRSIEKTFTVGEEDLTNDLNKIMGRVRLSLENQITKIAGDRSFGNIEFKEFKDLSIPKKELSNFSKAIRDNLQSVFTSNYVIARKELPKKEFARVKQVTGMDKTRADRFLSQKALHIKDVMNQDVLAAIQNLLAQAIKYDESMKDVIRRLDTDTNIRAYLPEVDAAGRTINVAARLENIARTNTAEAVNQSRMSLFGDPALKGFVRAYEYSAAMDGRTTDICSTLHGQVKREWDNYLPPNHYQCRSILIPVTEVDDWDEEEYNIPARTKPQQGFG